MPSRIADVDACLAVPFGSSLWQRWIAGSVSPVAWRNGVEPLPFDDWCRYIDGSPLTARQHWVFEVNGLLRAQNLFSGRRVVQELDLVWGKGSGKGYICAKLFTWAAYVLAMMEEDPAQLFGLAARTGLVGMNIAPNQDLARNVFFKYVRRFLMHPIFQHIDHEALTDEARFYRSGAFGRYESFSLYSRHSNGSGLDGHNLILWVMDEADAFTRTAARNTAREVHSICRSSASTRVGRGWLGVVISYPRTEDGFMLTRHREALAEMEALGDRSTSFTDLAATWDVRPSVSPDLPTIVQDYRIDPAGARAKYECIPLSADSAFFENTDPLDDAQAKPNSRPVARWRVKQTLGAGGYPLGAMVAVELDRVEPAPGRRYVLTGNGGVSGDRYALVVWHAEVASEQPVEVQWLCPDCAIDLPFYLEAQFGFGEPLDHRVYVDAQTVQERPECVACGCHPPGSPLSLVNANGGARFRPSGWRRTKQVEQQAIEPLRTASGEVLRVPRLVEDLVITWEPRHSVRGSKPAVVDLENVELVVRELVERLGVRIARFDPWQSLALVQRLNGYNGCDAQTLPFSNGEQFLRARTLKALLSRGYISLQPHRLPVDGDSWSHDDAWSLRHTGEAARDREWRRLERRGARIDHPPGGSKDIFDAESMAAWAAATDVEGRIDLLWAD